MVIHSHITTTTTTITTIVSIASDNKDDDNYIYIYICFPTYMLRNRFLSFFVYLGVNSVGNALQNDVCVL